MKNAFFLVFILMSLSNALAQNNKYFDDFELDSTYTVIGMGPYLMQNVDKYERFEFIINDKKNLNKLKDTWLIGNKVPPVIQRNLFSVTVIKDKRVVKSGVLNPANSNLRWKDGWYSFDTNYLADLGKKNHLNYTIEEKTVTDSLEYSKLYLSVKDNPLLLYVTKPSFSFEGKFTIILKYSSQLKSPADAISYLNEKFKPIQTGKTPSLGFLLDKFNMDNNNVLMRITIYSDHELYTKLEKKSYEISDWEFSKYKCTLFWQQ